MKNNSFHDHYENLQISSNADQETIERIYRLLAKRYHPDNLSSGSTEKFDAITKAYKTLSDPEKRAAYDAAYENDKREFFQTASRVKSTDGQKNDLHIRRYILSILCIERRKDPENASVGLWQLEKLLGWPEKLLEFHSWYLKEKGLIERTDTGGFAITYQGVDELEKDGFILGKDRLLPESTETDFEARSESFEQIGDVDKDTAEALKRPLRSTNKKSGPPQPIIPSGSL
jgi:curved DNA-binding protein CbpA